MIRALWEFLKCRWLPHREYPFDVETGGVGAPVWRWRIFSKWI